MAIYYNKNKKTFIQSNESEEILREKKFNPVYLSSFDDGNVFCLLIKEKDHYEELFLNIKYDNKSNFTFNNMIELNDLYELKMFFNYIELYIHFELEKLKNLTIPFSFSKFYPYHNNSNNDFYLNLRKKIINRREQNEKAKITKDSIYKDLSINNATKAFSKLCSIKKDKNEFSLLDSFYEVSIQFPKKEILWLESKNTDCFMNSLPLFSYICSINYSDRVEKSFFYSRGDSKKIYFYPYFIRMNYKLFWKKNLIYKFVEYPENFTFNCYDLSKVNPNYIDYDNIFKSLCNYEKHETDYAYLEQNINKQIASQIQNDFAKTSALRDKINKENKITLDEFKLLSNKFDLVLKEFNGIKQLAIDNIQNLCKEHKKIFDEEIKKIFAEMKSKIETISANALTMINQRTTEIFNINKKLDDQITQLDVIVDKKVKQIKETNKELSSQQDALVSDITKKVIAEVTKLNPTKTIVINIPNQESKKIKGIFHEAFPKVLKLVSINSPVYLVGPAGAGKNVMLKQVAEALDLDWYYVNDAREKYDLMGFVDANGVYQETQFFKAFTKGGLIMVDEMDSAQPDVLLLLNSALGTGDDFYLSFPNGKHYKAHPNFHLVAAGNTFGVGSNDKYTGRNQLDAASLNRFVPIPIDYDTNIEQAITVHHEILPLYWEIRRIIKENNINYVVSTRNIVNADKFLSNNFDLDDIFTWTLKGCMTDDDISVIVKNITTTDYYTKQYLAYLKRNYDVKNFDERKKDDYQNGYETNDYRNRDDIYSDDDYEHDYRY